MEKENIIIEINSLKKSYSNLEVLKGINLNIKRQEKIAIMGSNGCGKSTLVEIIAQVKHKTKGEINFNFLKDNIKDAIGIQFQEGIWPASISAYNILDLYKEMYDSISEENLNNLIKAFGITSFYKRPLNHLSGGQKQRFNALLAILHNPELIILDEITNGLDLELKYNVLFFLKEFIKKNKNTLLLVSHSPAEVELLCDRLLIIDKGIIFFDMQVKDIIQKYGSVENLMKSYFKGEIKNAIVN